MSERANDPLVACIDLLKGRLHKNRGRGVNEQNTKASLIEPLLRSLGWDTDDFEVVHREYKSKRADRPVDYALQLAAKPVIFIEAKGLGENLSDRRWVSQILSYATVAGVIWCILTDGDEYRFYNASAPVDADEKLFCQVRLSDAEVGQLASVLGMISQTSIEKGTLTEFWEAHFVDRQVRNVLREILGGNDPRFVRLLKKHVPDLTDRQLVNSIARMEIAVGGQIVTPSNDDSLARQVPAAVRRKPNLGTAGKKPKKSIGVSLQQSVQAGLFAAPLKLFRKYKGKSLQATLRPDGTVEFNGQSFASCSTAAEHARGTVTGRRMNTNGWSFWQYTDGDGKPRELQHARNQYLKGKHQT